MADERKKREDIEEIEEKDRRVGDTVGAAIDHQEEGHRGEEAIVGIRIKI